MRQNRCERGRKGNSMDVGTLIDEISELVYVADLCTHELLFLNTAGKKMFGLSSLAGKTCYAVLHGREEPCTFCDDHLLRENSFHQWECTYAAVGRHCLLRDRLICWKDRPARLVIALDITEQQAQKMRLQSQLAMEEIVLECVTQLHQSADLPRAISSILQKIGCFLLADRVRILEVREDAIKRVYEWCDEGVEVQVQQWQQRGKLRLKLLQRCCKALRTGGLQVFDDSHPQARLLLRELDVERLHALELVTVSGTIGYVVIENLKAHAGYGKSLLDTIGYFIASGFEKIYAKAVLENLRVFDELTGLYNRSRFVRDLDALEGARRIGMACVSVNGMKEENDRYGHAHGDQTLVRVAQLLRGAFAEANAYRTGGDEFVLLWEKVPELSFQKRIGELKNALLLQMEGRISLGYAWAVQTESLQGLLSETERRMYEDKRRYYRENPQTIRYRRSVDEALRLADEGALQRALGEERFLVYLQTKHSFDDRRLVGAEALIRYRGADGALVMPDAFIPTLEQSKCIKHLDFYVFSQICMRMRDWMQQHKPVVPVAVNFSRYTLLEKNFVERLKAIRARCGVPERLVEIEITENGDGADQSYVFSIVERLKAAGFRVGIDDFGVKYANLMFFTGAPIDTLKLDKSLLINLRRNEKTQVMIKALAQICRSMDIAFVIEGVETEEQFRILKNLHCGGAQGYLFSRPMPLAEYEMRWLY